MRILYKDIKNGVVKVLPENIDDLWHLYYIIEKGDLVKSLTFRTAEQDNNKIRSKKIEKKPMLLSIKVEDVDFHQFSDILRIHGIIKEGPQDLGSYHTINVRIGEHRDITIIKDRWKIGQLSRLEEAVESTERSNIIFVSIDDDEAVVGTIRNSGIQIQAEVFSNRPGKMYQSYYNERSYFGEILSVLREIKETDIPILIVGPGFTKDRFLSFGKDMEPNLFKRVFLHGTGSNGLNGVYEAMKSGAANKINTNNRILTETNLIEKIMEEIAKNGLVAYGIYEVKSALEKGAVEHLIILDKLARTDEGEKMLSMARYQKSHFSIINSLGDAGKRLEGLGEVAALLRFRID